MYSVTKRATDGQGSLATFLTALLALLVVLVIAGPALGKDGRDSGRGASPDRSSGRASAPSPAARGRHDGDDGGARRSDGRSRGTLGSGNGNDAGNGRGAGSGGKDRGRQPGSGHQDGGQSGNGRSGGVRTGSGRRDGRQGEDSGRKRRGDSSGGHGRNGGRDTDRRGDHDDGPLASTASTGKNNQTGGSVAGPSSTGGGSVTSGGSPNPLGGGSNSSIPSGGTAAAPGAGVLPTVSPIPPVVAAPVVPATTTGAVAGQTRASGSTRGSATALQRLLNGAATGDGVAPLVGTAAATPTASRSAQRSTKPAAAARGNQGNAPGGAVKEIRKIVERVPGIVWAALAALGGLALVLVPLALVSTARSRRRGQLVEQLESVAATDALTGLLNRGALERGLQAELGRAQRYGRPLSLVYFDVNGLKAINDMHGHATGDRLLQTIAQLFDDTSRDHDLCGRMGGDECVVVLTEQDAAGAAAFGERVLERLPEKRSELGLASQWGLTAGIAAFPEDGETASELLAAADQRLYLQRGIRIEPRS